MLFTFPSRYSSAIGLPGVFSLAGWSRLIRTGFPVPRPTQGRARSAQGCAYGALTPFGPPLQTVPLPLRHRSRRPLLPRSGRNRHGLGSSRSARRYSGNHCCLLLLRVLRCFSSPGSPPHPCGCRAPSAAGFPIRTPADLRPFAPPRGFSQLVTSFLASGSPGIPRAPFSSSPAGRPAPAGRPPAAALLLSSFFLALPPRQRTYYKKSGEYRSRTDDPLLAKQML